MLIFPADICPQLLIGPINDIKRLLLIVSANFRPLAVIGPTDVRLLLLIGFTNVLHHRH